MEPNVYVIQQAKPRVSDGWVPNLEPATRFGNLRFVFDAEDRPHADIGAAMKKAIARLKDFDPDRDYICWSNFGDPAGMWLVIFLLASTGCDFLRFLYWSRGRGAGSKMSNENGYYFPVEMSVRELKRRKSENVS